MQFIYQQLLSDKVSVCFMASSLFHYNKNNKSFVFIGLAFSLIS